MLVGGCKRTIECQRYQKQKQIETMKRKEMLKDLILMNLTGTLN